MPGHDGSWSQNNFPLDDHCQESVIEQAADIVASDCPLAGLQLDQAGATTHVGGKATKHPIQIVRDAYGLPS
jgi:hypothetical protein